LQGSTAIAIVTVIVKQIINATFNYKRNYSKSALILQSCLKEKTKRRKVSLTSIWTRQNYGSLPNHPWFGRLP